MFLVLDKEGALDMHRQTKIWNDHEEEMRLKRAEMNQVANDRKLCVKFNQIKKAQGGVRNQYRSKSKDGASRGGDKGSGKGDKKKK